jgi:hypothetical protein
MLGCLFLYFSILPWYITHLVLLSLHIDVVVDAGFSNCPGFPLLGLVVHSQCDLKFSS